ncbi:MAG: phenylacetate-CoA oxygenase subunit PaaJ [Flavobacteriales bacterium]|nr:phenylacetate-CoA oxygenase subunit PaaJ [Flavobacteriales bacterium]MCB9335279.1 phenylacetate-CoA oxygenase subunit PaaJ [Flavobacteriales bacterium]
MVTPIEYSKEQIWEFLSEIPDPEIPVITIEELGVLRNVDIIDNRVIVTITPTYTGCPAMKMFEDDIIKTLHQKGIKNIEINMVFSPAWTTDWMSEEAREKLRKFGISPPIKGTADKGVLFANGPKNVPCPNCGSTNTNLKSQFGSTACKALYTCNDCLEPFDYFKCI